jgi:predicted porin
MKKLILATALAALGAAAQAETANVVITGKLHTYVDSVKRDGAERVSRVTSSPDSGLIFMGREELGHGLTANFMINTALQTDNPADRTTQLGNKELYVGLSTREGGIRLGRAYHAMFFHAVEFEFGDRNKNASLVGLHEPRAFGFGNGVFLHANPAKNVTVKYDRGVSETAGTPDAHVYSVLADVGPAKLGALYYDNSRGDTTAQVSGLMKFGATSVGGVYSDHKYSVGGEKQTWQVGAQQQLTPQISVSANYADTSRDDKGFNLIGTYQFSKRTAMHVKYRDLDLNGTREKLTAIGIDHWF